MVFLLNKTDQKQIAKQYNLNYRVFCSWLHSLTYVRNICAHHGRLWDRRLSIKMMIPKQEGWKTVDPTNITSTIHMILCFFSKINLEKEQVNAWCNRYIELLSSPLSRLETHGKLLKLKQIQESSLWVKHT